MMEFTMARVALMACGIVLLAAVVPSVTSIYDDAESNDLQENTEELCRMINAFCSSQADELIINLNSLLPLNCTVNLHRFFVTVSDGECQYRYHIEYILFSDKSEYNGNDCIRMTKELPYVYVSLL